MKFKIISTFTVFHNDTMIVCNAGQTVDLPEELAAQYVAAGLAEPAKAKKGKTEKVEQPDGAPVDPPVTDDADADAAEDESEGDAPAADEGAAPIA